MQLQAASAKDPDESDENQVDRHDVVQKAGHGEDQDTGNQGNQRANTEMEIHMRPCGRVGVRRHDHEVSLPGVCRLCASERQRFEWLRPS